MNKPGLLVLTVVGLVTVCIHSPLWAQAPKTTSQPTSPVKSDAALLKAWAPSLTKHLQAAATMMEYQEPNTEYLRGTAFYALSQAYSSLGNYAEAVKMAALVPYGAHRTKVLVIAGTKQATVGKNLIGAKRTLGLAKTAALAATDSLSIDKALTDVSEGYTQINLVNEAKALLPLIKDESYRKIARYRIAGISAQRGDVSVALENYKAVPLGEDASFEILELVRGYIKSGQLVKASNMIQYISSPEKKVEAIIAIARAENLKGDAAKQAFQPAIEIATKMEDDEEGEKSDTIEVIAKALIEQGDLEAAEKLMSSVSATNVYDANVQLAKALAQRGHSDKATTLAANALKAENGMNLYVDMLCEIGQIQWKKDVKAANQTFADALKQADAMGKTTNERNWAVVRIVKAVAQTKNFGRAETLTSLINIPKQKSQALAYIAVAQARGGNLEKANDTLERALAARKEITVPETITSVAETIQLVSEELLPMKIED